ncbi:MAG TPA: T9SS type A sorting domain-containing protein, partial [Chitinophagaceae bacterium]|nr:T9SS type A sorting domain-containing protein [Chitinophagaceae bacterium]
DGGRTIGDLVISVSFQNSGGSLASIEYFQWQPTGNNSFAYFPILPPTGSAFTAVNPVEVNVPFGAFGSTTYSPATFIETAVSLTTLIGGVGPGGSGPFGSVWVKSKSNDNFDDFYPPIQFASTFGSLSVTYFFYDLYTAQLNANIAPLNPADYNFHWTAIGATNGTFVDPSVTGTLNNYNIPDPIFSADTNYNCISYIYKVTVSPKSNPGSVTGQTYVVINSPCKIGKPINPDQMQLGEVFPEVNRPNDQELNVFPNPVKGWLKITLGNDAGAKDIHVIDMNGKIVQRWSGVTTNIFQLKDLPAGLYLLKVFSKTSGKTTTKKIIIDN